MIQMLLLGAVEIIGESGQEIKFRSQTEVALLAYLAQTGRIHSREAVADLLWDARTTQQSLSNLRTVLTRLRKRVGDTLLVTRKTVGYAPAARLQVDSAQLIEQLATLQTLKNRADATRLAAALGTYRGHFLTSFYLRDAPRFNEWAVIEQEHVRQMAFAGYGRLLTFALAENDVELALETAWGWQRWDPYNETVHRHLIRLLAESGQLKAALAQHERFVALLQAELGVEPQQATAALYKRIQQAALAASAAPPAVQQHNLPRQMTRLFGRKTEIERLRNSLLNRHNPLITISGVGGSGKTSLALAVGRALLSAENPYRDGIWFVPLENVENSPPAAVQSAVATAIGRSLDLIFHDQSEPWEQLLKQLSAKQLLIILDNVEQLLPALTDLLVALLAACERLDLLVTSRSSLALPGNLAVPLHGLALPGTEPASSNASIQLFAARAAQLPITFDTAAHLDNVAAICHSVDGLPLGIELAAAALDRLTIDEIQTAISSNLALLATTKPNLPPRQRTLSAVFDTSWHLLSRHEQLTLARISVFHGGFTRESAETVLGSLDSSLYHLQHHALLTRSSTGRFVMHPLVRQLAHAKLLAMPEIAADALRQHGRYFGRFVQARAAALQGSHAQQTVQTMLPEQPNLRAAWHHAVQTQNWALIADMLSGLHHFYRRIGGFNERNTLIDEALATLQSTLDPGDSPAVALQSRLLTVQAWGCLQTARLDDGIELAQRACALAQQVDSAVFEAQARVIWARLLVRKVDSESALAQFEQVVALAVAAQHPLLEADGWSGIGSQYLYLPDVTPARQPLERALELCRAADYKVGEMEALMLLGGYGHRQDQPALARSYFDQALQLSQLLGDVTVEAGALGSLGVIVMSQGDWVGALTYYEQALATYQRLNIPESKLWMLSQMGLTATRLGDFATAEERLQAALEIANDIEDVFWQARVKLQLCSLWVAQGDTEDALTTIAEAARDADRSGHPLLPGAVLLAWGWALLGQKEWARAAQKFTQTIAFWQARDLPQDRDAVAALAGLAYATLQQGNRQQAAEHAERLWQIWQSSPDVADKIDLKPVWMLGMVWQALGDARADQVWKMGRSALQLRSGRIDDDRLRRLFMENIPAHRAISAYGKDG